MKKNLRKVTVGLLFCSLFQVISAQDVNVDIATERNLMSKNISSKVNAEGSPYIDENFSSVRIAEQNNKIYVARYNAYNGELEVKLDKGKIIALDNNSDYEVTFTLTDKKYKTKTYITESGVSKRGFLVVLSENENHSLFKEERIKYYEKVEATSSYQQNKPAKFKKQDDLYYIQLGDVVTIMPQKKRDLLKAFPENSKKLKSYMKTNKLNPKHEDDLIKIADYLSTLK
ncbi:hypothetical protein ITJ86_14970 [Winogradskyella sp. F6397]|uniref:Uncharacterized protein n=1 Tax=Winogradskyella marina TaxID=2785530 RepID=A0ABS0ELB4_9FLAO|nr:hypothetical protein [Winogradskyella marina]MBF8151209.1 hypothetical protein [Winogradskyella marina]